MEMALMIDYTNVRTTKSKLSWLFYRLLTIFLSSFSSISIA